MRKIGPLENARERLRNKMINLNGSWKNLVNIGSTKKVLKAGTDTINEEFSLMMKRGQVLQ